RQLPLQRPPRLYRRLSREHRQGRRARLRHPADAAPVGEPDHRPDGRAGPDRGPQRLPRLCGGTDEAIGCAAGEGSGRQMSWRVTVPCTRAQAEAIVSADPFAGAGNPPVLVADEPDPSKPDEWLIHAYFDHEPKSAELKTIAGLGRGEPKVEQLGEADWVRMSQEGLQPIRAGRFYVHTPMYRESVPEGATAFEIDASLAFGTGQHATTSGCLAALDQLERKGAKFANIADIGTGTGILAFAALALWP